MLDAGCWMLDAVWESKTDFLRDYGVWGWVGVSEWVRVEQHWQQRYLAPCRRTPGGGPRLYCPSSLSTEELFRPFRLLVLAPGAPSSWSTDHCEMQATINSNLHVPSVLFSRRGKLGRLRCRGSGQAAWRTEQRRERRRWMDGCDVCAQQSVLSTARRGRG